MIMSDLPVAARRSGLAAALASTFLTYLLLGAAGISFAIAPGYASPIFPACGFAVAALLWHGRRVLPAIWLGSSVLNLSMAILQGHPDLRSFIVAGGIASGATVQAMVAWWLLQRFAKGSWKLLETERDIVLCLSLAGPLACVISASVGILVLCSAGLMTLVDAPYALFNWWLGDVLGVWTLLPLSLAVYYRHQSVWRTRLTDQVFPMVLVLSLTGVAFWAASDWERTQLRLRIEKHGQALVQQLQQRFVAHQEALAALRRLLEVTPDMKYANFEYFTRLTLRDNPDIFAISINPFVTDAQRPGFEQAMRQVHAGFEIRERDSEQQLVREQPRPEYVPVGFIAPLQGNLPAIGFDINSDPVRSDAIRRARLSAVPAVTAPVRLVQEHQPRVGVLVLHPAYAFGSKLERVPSQAQLQGFVVGVIKVDEMVEIATREIRVPGLMMRLQDPDASAAKSPLFTNETNAVADTGRYTWVGTVPIADHRWSLSVYPTGGYLQRQRNWLSLLTGGGGFLLASLLQVLLLGTTGRTSVVERIVRQQTQELIEKGLILEDRNAELDALFTLSPDGLVALDPNGTIKYINPAFQSMTGISVEDLVGENEAVLQSRLSLHADQDHTGVGNSETARKLADGLDSALLHLKKPRHRVIQMVSVRSDSVGLPRILYFRDITVESEVAHLKSEFLSVAAHELRTPMASVFGFAEVLMTHELQEPERKELLGIIYRQSGLMADILNELLDLARIEARRGQDFVFGEVSVHTLLDSELEGFKLPDGRRLPEVPQAAAHCSIWADRSKGSQAIRNVLSNAYKYSPEGGVVEIALLENPSSDSLARVGIRITDHGIGMTPDQTKHVCERFYRADNSGKIPGTGLGMSIVKEIVELHGGTVEVRSEAGNGTSVTLWFCLPPGHETPSA